MCGKLAKMTLKEKSAATPKLTLVIKYKMSTSTVYDAVQSDWGNDLTSEQLII